MPYLEKFLYIKKSTLPNAGKGLFTKKAILKSERIIEYKGKLKRWVDVKEEDGYNEYLLQVTARKAIDAKSYPKALARYVNDANGRTKVEGIKNNCEFVSDGTRCYIEAKRAINKYEEILVGYGRAYWILNKKIRALQHIKTLQTLANREED